MIPNKPDTENLHHTYSGKREKSKLHSTDELKQYCQHSSWNSLKETETPSKLLHVVNFINCTDDSVTKLKC